MQSAERLVHLVVAHHNGKLAVFIRQPLAGPIGGGIGRLIKLAALPMQISAHAFDNVERPAGAPRWSLRFSVSFLFPK